MPTTDDTLFENFADSTEELERAHARIVRLERENELLAEELRLLRAKRFGSSSEKTTVLDGQELLFNEAEFLMPLKTPEPTLEEITYRRAKTRGKREADLSGLPLRRIDYELTKEECICPECAGPLHEMDIDIRRELEYIPSKVTVIEHATHVYACRHCQAHAAHTPIIKATSPAPLLKGSLVSASLMAQVLCDKYQYHLPLYRQEQAFSQEGLSLKRNTLANWVIHADEDWLRAIYDKMKERLVSHEVLCADETVLQVLKEPGRTAKQKSYMWLYRTGKDTSHPLVLYEYKPSRSHEHPKAFLKDFSGYLHADGYGGYHKLPPNIVVVGCWAHLRRKFDEALKATPEAKRAGSAAERGLAYCNELFALERTFDKLDDAARHARRQEQSLPLALEFRAWAQNAGVLPKSLVGKAVHYLLSQWVYLIRVFDDGRLEISNNRSERSIKPFVIGRKGWLFSNTPRGARASATIFSVIETAKENHLRPYEYLKYLFERLPETTTSELDDLMPWSGTIPEYVKVPKAY